MKINVYLARCLPQLRPGCKVRYIGFRGPPAVPLPHDWSGASTGSLYLFDDILKQAAVIEVNSWVNECGDVQCTLRRANGKYMDAFARAPAFLFRPITVERPL